MFAFQDANGYVCFMTKQATIAVLTGDLIASQAAGAAKVEAAMDHLAATAADLGADTRFTRFRGDGWQIVLTDPLKVLRAVLLLLADLRASGIGLDTRISAGIGGYETLGTANLADAAGRAFLLSGVKLDNMDKHGRISINGAEERDQHWQRAIFDLVDWHTSQWTAAQAEAAALALRHYTENQGQLAQRLGITRQAMQSRLAGAGMHALDRAIQAFEGPLWKRNK
jgi:hypothetical protein